MPDINPYESPQPIDETKTISPENTDDFGSLVIMGVYSLPVCVLFSGAAYTVLKAAMDPVVYRWLIIGTITVFAACFLTLLLLARKLASWLRNP